MPSGSQTRKVRSLRQPRSRACSLRLPIRRSTVSKARWTSKAPLDRHRKIFVYADFVVVHGTHPKFNKFFTIFFPDVGIGSAMRVGYGMVIARIKNRGGLSACSGARRQRVSMSLTAKRQLTGKKLAANHRSGPRALGGGARRMNGLPSGRHEHSEGGRGQK